MDAVIASAGDHSLNQYGSGAGLPDLVKALKQKLVTQNSLEQVHMFNGKERKKKRSYREPLYPEAAHCLFCDTLTIKGLAYMLA